MQHLYTAILLSISVIVFSQTRKYSNEFLAIGVDARAFGMGNAVVANQGDANSVYWNPAGLSDVENGIQIAAMHSEYFQSIAKYDYASVAIPLRNTHTIGFAFYRFGVDDILNTTELIDNQGNIDYSRLSTFSTADYAGTLSYAGRFFGDDNLTAGATAKIVYRHIGKFANAFGFGFDVGLRYHTDDDWYFGLMARDITTTFNVWSVNEDELKQLEVEGVILNTPPEESIELTLPKLKVGASKKFNIHDKFTILPEIDLEFNFAEENNIIRTESLSINPSMGIEFGYEDMIFLRGGINNLQYETNFNNEENLTMQPNLGIGVKFKGISLDYALTDIGDNSIALYSNVFSIKIDLGEF